MTDPSLPPEDGEYTDPYEDIDVSTLPEWWRKTIEEFREYDLRPYQPPRFEDGVLEYEVLEELEASHDIEIRLVERNASYGGNWNVLVDGDRVGTVRRRRSPEGYTILRTTSKAFVELVESAIDAADT